MSASVTFEVVDGIGVLTLASPETGNCMNLPFVAAFLDATEAARRSGVPVVVLQAQGRFFSVGGDLAAFAAAEDPTALIEDVAGTLHRGISQLLRLDAIVVVALQGAAAGAGLPLALAGDLILAGESAKLTLAYTNVGLSPDGGSTALLPASLGLHKALHLALLNPVLSAQEAKDLGLVVEVVPDDDLAERVRTLARALRDGPIRASIAARRLLRASLPAPETQMEIEARSIAGLLGGAEAREGIAAFLDKRKPDFTQV
jgi:2-(1,2-epoxy-1,2-dihydrophenyl)acetyl-CoA isomerase